jgi:hypothetical protein
MPNAATSLANPAAETSGGAGVFARASASAVRARHLGRDDGAFDAARLARFDFLTLLAMGAMVAATIAGARLRGIDMTFANAAPVLALVGFFGGLSAFYTFARPDGRIAAVGRTLAEFLVFPILGLVYTYTGAAWGGPDMTAPVAAVDRMLGFDWVAQWHFLRNNPAVDHTLLYAYSSMSVQFIVLPLALMARGHFGHARMLMNCFILGIGVTMLVAMAVPVVDAIAWHGLTPLDSRGYSGAPRIDHLLQLRDGTLTRIDVAQMWGIICFPSFHVTAGFLFVCASAPFGALRWPMLALNAAMIAAVPRWGGHHLADIGGGLLVGLAVYGAALAFTRARRA